MLEAQTDSFEDYIIQVKKSTQALSKLVRLDTVSTGGTDSHIVFSFTKDKVSLGNQIEKICEYVDISINKNTFGGYLR